VMDALPLVLAASQTTLRAVRVRRVVDAATRRPQLGAKVGAGLTPEEFAAGAKSGELGHVGLPASARLLAQGLGWKLDAIRESIRPVLGPDGRCRGARQRLRGLGGGEPRILVDLTVAGGARPGRGPILLGRTPPL